MIKKRRRIFFDTEFTELSEKAQLLSIGIISDDGATFYAELTDYDEALINPWVKEHVLGNFKFTSQSSGMTRTFNNHKNIDSYSIEVNGPSALVKSSLMMWLHQFGEVEVWSDCLAYDWMLFNKIFGDTAMDIPKDLYFYIPMDLSTLLFAKGEDPDVNREKFAEFKGDESAKHNALHDAIIIKQCFDKLMHIRGEKLDV